MLEHTGGALPTWMSPVQAIIVPISDKVLDYAFLLCKQATDMGIRAEVDDRNEKMGYKIREAEMKKTPFMLVVGEKEAADGTVSLRTYRDGQQPTTPAAEVLATIVQRIQTREFDVTITPLRTFDVEDESAAAEADEY